MVPTRDRREQLETTLASVVAASRPGDEIIVADSASADASVAAAVARRLGARCIRCETPGASLARNTGWRAAANSIVAFVDDDVVVSAHWADAITAPFSHPDVAFVTGRIGIAPDQQHMERPVAVKLDPHPARLDGDTTGVIGGSGNLAVRTEVLDRLGGFDERLGPGTPFHAAEDYDLFDRLFAAGYTGRYEPLAGAYHDLWRDRRQLLALDWRYGVGTGARLAKLARTDRRRARSVALEHLWRNGARAIARDLRNGYEFGVLMQSVRIAGTAAGFARARVVPMDAGHLRPRS